MDADDDAPTSAATSTSAAAATPSSATPADVAFWDDLAAFVDGVAQTDAATSADAVRPADAGGAAAPASDTRTARLLTPAALLAAHPFPTLFLQLARAVAAGSEPYVRLAVGAIDRLVVHAVATAPATYAAALVPVAAAALTSGHEAVRRLAARAVARIARAHPPGGWVAALLDAATLRRCVAALRDPVAAVAEPVEDALVAAAALPGGLPPVVTALRSLDDALAAGDAAAAAAAADDDADDADDDDGVSIVRARLLAVVSRIIGASDAGADALAAAGLLDRVAAAASDTDDVLLQCTSLELVPAMAASARGAAAIVERGLWAALLRWAGVVAPADAADAADTEADALLAASALTAVGGTFAATAASAPALTPTLRAPLLPGLFHRVAAACAVGVDSHTSAAAIAALAAVLAADVPALTAALAPPAAPAMREWLECGASSVPQLRAAAFDAVASVLRSAPTALARAAATAGAAAGGAGAGATSASDDDVWAPYHELFDRLGRACGMDTVTLALRSLAKPAEEARLAAYGLLAAVAALRDGGWGLRRVYATPDAAAALLDRRTEVTKVGKDWKFAVIDASLGNPAAPAVLGDAFLAQLRSWHRAGAYAADGAAPAVAAASR